MMYSLLLRLAFCFSLLLGAGAASASSYEAPLPEDIKDEELLKALDTIPEMFRVIVLLADVQEFSYKEIATMLEIPVGTVMSRLSRGRKHLREQLLTIAPGFTHPALPAREGRSV